MTRWRATKSNACCGSSGVPALALPATGATGESVASSRSVAKPPSSCVAKPPSESGDQQKHYLDGVLAREARRHGHGPRPRRGGSVHEYAALTASQLRREGRAAAAGREEWERAV